MKKSLIAILVLAAMLPRVSHSKTTNHLLQSNPGPHVRIVEVFFTPEDGKAGQSPFRFGNEGGRLDLKTGVVQGKARDGTKIEIPLARVAMITVEVERGSRRLEYDLLLDALNTGATWPPKGRIRMLMLTSGMWIYFKGAAPGIDSEEPALFWSCGGETATRIPFDDIVFVQIVSNSFVGDFNDLADVGYVGEVELLSGQVIDPNGQDMLLDLAAGVVRFGAETVALQTVHRVLVKDCRPQVIPPVATQERSVKSVAVSLDLQLINLSGQRVKVRKTGRNENWMMGKVLSQDKHGLELIVKADTLSIPLAEIEDLKVSRGMENNSRNGALLCGVIGGAAGLGVGLSFANDEFFNIGGGEVLIGAMLGFMGGVVVGGVIGSAIQSEKWEDARRVQVGVVRTPNQSPGLALGWRF